MAGIIIAGPWEHRPVGLRLVEPLPSRLVTAKRAFLGSVALFLAITVGSITGRVFEHTDVRQPWSEMAGTVEDAPPVANFNAPIGTHWSGVGPQSP